MISSALQHSINSGKCFIFVGSGPSCEMGYPSWHKLASDITNRLEELSLVPDRAPYDKYLSRQKYPELFTAAEQALGGREKLIELIKEIFTSITLTDGKLYSIIARWPVPCYLTTNFDDEIDKHLKAIGTEYVTIQNEKEDFFHYRADTSGIIQKLHGDLEHPDLAVITAGDFKDFWISDDRQYFRDKLRQIFEFNDLLIIGHSISDPDIQFILQLASKTSNPARPIYLVLPNFNSLEESEYLQKYGTQIITYKASNGDHSQLGRIIRTLDKFITPRNQSLNRNTTPSQSREESDAAVSLFIHRKLADESDGNMLFPLVANVLKSADKSLSIKDLLSSELLKQYRSSPWVSEDSIMQVLKQGEFDGLIHVENDNYGLTSSGRESLTNTASTKEIEEKKALGQFHLTLKRNLADSISGEISNKCEDLAVNVIIESFKQRGLTLANQIYNGSPPSVHGQSDIFSLIASAASEFDSLEVRTSFINAMHEFLIQPTPEQKIYLTSLSQGYFLFHILELDPACSKLKQELFQNTYWILDSSAILPLLAQGCVNHDFTSELFDLLQTSDSNLLITDKLLLEAYEHLQWCNTFVQTHGVDSDEFLRASLGKGSYKQNLFIDGFVRLAAQGEISSFSDYIDSIVPDGLNIKSIEKFLERRGIFIVSPTGLKTFTQAHQDELSSVKEKVKSIRLQRSTFRSDRQVDSEAEILVYMNMLRSGNEAMTDNLKPEAVYFMSGSTVLENIDDERNATTWSPEGVYKHISSLPGYQTNPELLQQCMLQDYYFSEVTVVDNEHYKRFFGPNIESAKIKFLDEKDKYCDELEVQNRIQFEDDFENLADLEKPEFVAQMGWRLARESQERESIARKKVIEAEEKLRTLERERESGWKRKQTVIEKQEEARIRHQKDPKYVRKLDRQKKKRLKQKGR